MTVGEDPSFRWDDGRGIPAEAGEGTGTGFQPEPIPVPAAVYASESWCRYRLQQVLE